MDLSETGTIVTLALSNASSTLVRSPSSSWRPLRLVVLRVHGDELRMRWMTPREYARLQGAGDFVLPENTIQALFGFGDAVCVPAIAWIDRRWFRTPRRSFIATRA